MKKEKANCCFCGKEFTKVEKRNIFCSKHCSQQSYSSKNFSFNVTTQRNLCAYTEILVSADLLKNNYEVYRPLSANARVDLIAIKEELLYRVEVKTGHKNLSTGRIFLQAHKHTCYDIIAHYIPELGEILYKKKDGQLWYP